MDEKPLLITRPWFIIVSAILFTALFLFVYSVLWCSKEGEVVKNPYKCCIGTTFIPDRGQMYKCVPDSYGSGN